MRSSPTCTDTDTRARAQTQTHTHRHTQTHTHTHADTHTLSPALSLPFLSFFFFLFSSLLFSSLFLSGEFYFSDVYCDRRLTEEARKDPVLFGECLGGALYEHDFITLSKKVGFVDPREVSRSVIEVKDKAIRKLVGNATFYSITYRLFKLKDLEPYCEDHGPCCLIRRDNTRHTRTHTRRTRTHKTQKSRAKDTQRHTMFAFFAFFIAPTLLTSHPSLPRSLAAACVYRPNCHIQRHNSIQGERVHAGQRPHVRGPPPRACVWQHGKHAARHSLQRPLHRHRRQEPSLWCFPMQQQHIFARHKGGVFFFLLVLWLLLISVGSFVASLVLLRILLYVTVALK